MVSGLKKSQETVSGFESIKKFSISVKTEELPGPKACREGFQPGKALCFRINSQDLREQERHSS